MRPQKRSRGRNGGGNMFHNNQNRGGGGGPRPPHRSQTFDSNGPNVKIRGNAYQVYERYLALAREAQSSGDRIASENFYQHAEHYFRVMSANGEGIPQQRPPQMATEAEVVDGEGEQPEEAHFVQLQQPAPQPQPQPPPPPMPEEDQLPPFITGRAD